MKRLRTPTCLRDSLTDMPKLRGLCGFLRSSWIRSANEDTSRVEEETSIAESTKGEKKSIDFSVDRDESSVIVLPLLLASCYLCESLLGLQEQHLDFAHCRGGHVFCLCGGCITELTAVDGRSRRRICALTAVDFYLNPAQLSGSSSVAQAELVEGLAKTLHDAMQAGVNIVTHSIIRQGVAEVRKIMISSYVPLAEFHDRWQSQTLATELFDVHEESTEWDEVLRSMSTPMRTVVRILRIQSTSIWERYTAFKDSLRARNIDPTELRYWHGTRKNHPKLIYESVGFDTSKAKVWGCIWLAQQSKYSYGYSFSDGSNECIILALVAAGDSALVTDHGWCLNVFKNDAVYPAYVVWYR